MCNPYAADSAGLLRLGRRWPVAWVYASMYAATVAFTALSELTRWTVRRWRCVVPQPRVHTVTVLNQWTHHARTGRLHHTVYDRKRKALLSAPSSLSPLRFLYPARRRNVYGATPSVETYILSSPLPAGVALLICKNALPSYDIVCSTRNVSIMSFGLCTTLVRRLRLACPHLPLRRSFQPLPPPADLSRSTSRANITSV